MKAGGAVSPSTAPSAADVGADTLSLKQALEPVLHDVRPADAGVAAAGRMIVTEALAGKPISAATTAPYGCSIKYKSPA